MAGIGNGVDLDCSAISSSLARSYCLSLHTLSLRKRINWLLKILPVGKGNTKFLTGWCCIHWGSQSVNNQKCRTLIITSCVCISAAAFLPPDGFVVVCAKICLLSRRMADGNAFLLSAFPAESHVQPGVNISYTPIPVMLFLCLCLQLSDISPIGRDPSVSSFSSATLTPSSTCPSLVDSRCNSVDQK